MICMQFSECLQLFTRAICPKSTCRMTDFPTGRAYKTDFCPREDIHSAKSHQKREQTSSVAIIHKCNINWVCTGNIIKLALLT